MHRIFAAVFILVAFIAGWKMPEVLELFDRPQIGFEGETPELISWNCRLHGGYPSYDLLKGTIDRFGPVTCAPGGGPPTEQERRREIDRQKAWRESQS